MTDIIRALKNKAGDAMGLGCCPNCRDNWSWKPSGNLNFKQDGFGTHGVMICIECLEAAAPLDAFKIANYLNTMGWKAPDLRLVEATVANYNSS